MISVTSRLDSSFVSFREVQGWRIKEEIDLKSGRNKNSKYMKRVLWREFDIVILDHQA